MIIQNVAYKIQEMPMENILSVIPLWCIRSLLCTLARQARGWRQTTQTVGCHIRMTTLLSEQRELWMSHCLLLALLGKHPILMNNIKVTFQYQETGNVYLSPKYKQSEITLHKITVDIICNNFISENGKTQTNGCRLKKGMGDANYDQIWSLSLKPSNAELLRT